MEKSNNAKLFLIASLKLTNQPDIRSTTDIKRSQMNDFLEKISVSLVEL